MVAFNYLKRFTCGRYRSNGGARLFRIDDVKCPVGVVINPDYTDSLIAAPDEYSDPVDAEPRKSPRRRKVSRRSVVSECTRANPYLLPFSPNCATGDGLATLASCGGACEESGDLGNAVFIRDMEMMT
jgi:hypothetical protein